MNTTTAGYANPPLENQWVELGQKLFDEASVLKNVIEAALPRLSINLLVSLFSTQRCN